MYTSSRPDSSETYANHLPPGDSRELRSLYGVWNNTVAVAVPSIFRGQMSPLVLESWISITMVLPSGDQSRTWQCLSKLQINSSLPLPSAGRRNTPLNRSAREEAHATMRPSGDHTGVSSSPLS